MSKRKDYCTWFPEKWFGVYIGDCCKGHDSNCSTSQLFKCLRKKIGYFGSALITSGGGIGCWIRYTKDMVKRL